MITKKGLTNLTLRTLEPTTIVILRETSSTDKKLKEAGEEEAVLWPCWCWTFQLVLELLMILQRCSLGNSIF